MDTLNHLTDKELRPQKDIEQYLQENADMNRLLRKYISLLKKNFGEEDAMQKLQEILQSSDQDIKAEQKNEKSLPERIVLLNRVTGYVEVGTSDELGHLVDRPNFIDITNRLSDIFIYRSINPDDPHRLRCKVDGIQQTSVLLTPAQERYWQGARLHDMTERARYKLAGEIYASLLLGRNLQQERSKGMKR